jgi:hypothetical protein
MQYRNGMLSLRLDVDGAARAAGVRDALVLVRESWGAQVVARMWGLGVSRVAAEQYYRTADLCRLDEAVARVEREGGGAAALASAVAPLQADSMRLVSLTISTDSTGRVLRGEPLTATCTRRVIEDRAGFTVMAPVLLAGADGNRYVRDLHDRNLPMLAADSTRAVWLLTQSAEVGGALRFERVNLDSARADWRMR